MCWSCKINLNDEWDHKDVRKNLHRSTGNLRIVEFTNSEGIRKYRIEREIENRRGKKLWEKCKAHYSSLDLSGWRDEVYCTANLAKQRMKYIAGQMEERKLNFLKKAVVIASQYSDPDINTAMKEVERYLKLKQA